MAVPKKEENSIWKEKDYLKSSIFAKELKKDKYFQTLEGLSEKDREEIGKLLGDKRVFGEFIERGEVWKLESLEKELRDPFSSSDSKIREIGKKIREKYGKQRAEILADIIRKKFLKGK